MPDRSMNVFTEAAWKNLTHWSTRFVADDAVKGVVFTSGKKDLFRRRGPDHDEEPCWPAWRKRSATTRKSRQADAVRPGRQDELALPQDRNLRQAVGSAINGTCMGGAFELSLACHGRVAAIRLVKMALPEVKVGIFPGAGGTQRVPRLTNAQDALQMMTRASR
jgi:3-hydroxyacyl-CoA dehydrogenase/enoyl-CoA hydratase/3-hydroxybutyryl-CoA epimerase